MQRDAGSRLDYGTVLIEHTTYDLLSIQVRALGMTGIECLLLSEHCGCRLRDSCNTRAAMAIEYRLWGTM